MFLKYDSIDKKCSSQVKSSQVKSSQVKSSQVKLSFIVILLHVWTYSGMRCRASQDHGAT